MTETADQPPLLDDAARLRRWRLVLGEAAEACPPLVGEDVAMDAALTALYDPDSQGGLRGAEQFSPFEWRPCHGAGLALQGALASIACVVSSQVEMGTHTIFFGTVEEVLLTPSARPLLHYDRALRSVSV